MKKVFFLVTAGAGLLGYVLCRIALPLPVVLLVLTVLAVLAAVLMAYPVRRTQQALRRICKGEEGNGLPKFCYEEMRDGVDAVEEMAEALKQHVEELEQEKSIRQEFFSNASHELKTPITSIKGYAELLEGGFAQDEDTVRNFYQRIIAETDNMNHLINDILMISRLESNEIVEETEDIRMAPLLSELFDTLTPIAASFQVTLHKECMPLLYRGSRRQMKELLENLLSNAIKYNRKGGEVWVNIFSQNKRLCIIVKDTGVGISEEDQKRIFERFYRVDKGRSKATGGTGLGLSIVKHIVEYNHGSLSLESCPGRGSRFVIELPLQPI